MRQKGKLGWLKHDITHRGVTAWAVFLAMAAFYFFLYFPDKLGEFGQVMGVSAETQSSLWRWGNDLNVFEKFMRGLGGERTSKGWDPIWNKWTLYGSLYTIAITVGGIVAARKYRHNRYQVIRMVAIICVQVLFAFSLPMVMASAEQTSSIHYSGGYYFSYFWPLKVEYMWPDKLSGMPLYLMLYSVIGALLFVPVMGVFFGKRWYCAWVCGCGGLANTYGDGWRHLSNKSQAAWNFEKFSIHSVLVLAIATTGILGLSSLAGDQFPELGKFAKILKFFYGLIVVALLSGAIGTALYPLGGTRVWCRFFCPLAAILGLVQKFGRYRITVKKNMCISCGLCSKYCEMGIDVRAYAQKNQSFVRASCVGCGLCAEVCPRGVLRLEQRWDNDPQELTMNMLITEGYKAEPEIKAH
jgi:polyferredoxin